MENNNLKKYFALKEDVVLIYGAKRGLIYDLADKKIYSVNETAKLYISKLINGKSIDEVLNGLSIDNKKELISYLDLLCKNDLAYYEDKKVLSGFCKYNKNIKKELNTVWFELRKACNLKCCHCYMDCDCNRDKNLKILKLEDWKNIVDSLVLYKPKRIILIGGEPLIFNKINELIKYIREKLFNIEIVLYSNLTLLTDDLIRNIVNSSVKVVTSVYSNNEEIHDKITGIKGSFCKTISSIKKLRILGVCVKVNVVIMKYNSDNISDILKFTYNLTGIKSKVDIVRNVGADKQYLMPVKLSCRYMNKRNKPIFSGINKNQFIKNMSGNSCYQGKINIECDGVVSPCIMSECFVNQEFNIKDYSIDEILDKYLIPKFWSVSKDFIDECKDCEYRYVCKDCRPVNAEDNNKYSKGSNCTYNPYTGEWR